MELTEYELKIAQAAVAEYRKIMSDRAFAERLLETKKFKMGSYVTANTTSQLDEMFGILEKSIGRIVGYDTEYDYYRVYYSSSNPYVGVKEEKLEAYTGEPPSNLLNYDPKMVRGLVVDMRDSEVRSKGSIHVNLKTFNAVKDILGLEAENLIINNNVPIGKVVVMTGDQPARKTEQGE